MLSGLLVHTEDVPTGARSRERHERVRADFKRMASRLWRWANFPGARAGMCCHQRELVCVKSLAGARSVVWPCIAVTGLVPAARDRVEETTDGAAHDDRRDHRGVSMPRRARPDRQLEVPLAREVRQLVPCLAGGCRGSR